MIAIFSYTFFSEFYIQSRDKDNNLSFTYPRKSMRGSRGGGGRVSGPPSFKLRVAGGPMKAHLKLYLDPVPPHQLK